MPTELQQRVQAALQGQRDAEEERKERVRELQAQVDKRLQEQREASERKEQAFREAQRARLTRLEEEQYARLKAQYRRGFTGPSEEFEKIWPSVLASLLANAPKHRPDPL